MYFAILWIWLFKSIFNQISFSFVFPKHIMSAFLPFYEYDSAMFYFKSSFRFLMYLLLIPNENDSFSVTPFSRFVI